MAKLSAVMADLLSQCNYQPSQYDVTAAASTVVRGWTLGSRGPAEEVIGDLCRIYRLVPVKVDGKLKFVARGGPIVATIAAGDLAARKKGDKPGPPVRIRFTPPYELPLRVDLHYKSGAAELYESATQGEHRPSKAALTQQLVSYTIPGVLGHDEARQTAAILLYDQWARADLYDWRLPPKYSWLSPGDILGLPVEGKTHRVMITRMDVDPSGLLSFEGTKDDLEVLSQSHTGATFATRTTPTATATTLIHVMSTNALRDDDATSIGLYAAANGALGSLWTGCTLYLSRDAGVEYTELQRLTEPATLGTAATVLSSAASPDPWDRTNTVDITLTAGSPPVSTSEAAVLNGANVFLLGSEVIQATTVVSLGSNQYRLSGLLRGRRGTESQMSTHAGGERFIALDQGPVARIVLSDSLVGKSVTLKCVTDGLTLGDASPFTVTATGDEWKCYAPGHLAGSRDGANNLTLTWGRRARSGYAWVDMIDADQPEATLAYEVEILDSPGGSLLRTITGLTAETASYSAANQTTDGITPGDPVTFRVFQLGRFGRGYPAEATV